MAKYILDIDGTVLNGAEEINNSLSFLQSLESLGSPYLLASNSIKSREMQVARFQNLGFSVSPDHFYSPIDSINKHLLDEKISNVLIMGGKEEIDQIQANHTFESPELIILLDFEKNNGSYNDLQIVIDRVQEGCPIITASASPYYLKNGKKQIDTGAFVHLIESVMDLRIPVFGKPSSHYFLNAKSLLGNSNDITVIGDDWSTDILGAKKAGLGSILIKSGKYCEGDAQKGNPDSVIDDLLVLKA